MSSPRNVSNYTNITLHESFLQSGQTLKVTLPEGLIILLEVEPSLQSSYSIPGSYREVSIKLLNLNERHSSLLLSVHLDRCKKRDMVPAAPFVPDISIKLSTKSYHYVLSIKKC